MPYSAPVSGAAPRFDPAAVRAVAFDGFGTVFDYPVSRLRDTLARVAATLVPPVDGARMYEAWLEAGRRRWRQTSPEEGPILPHQQPFRRYSEFWPVQFADAIAGCGARGDAEAANAMLFDEIARSVAYPEAGGTIAALRRRVPVALVSNADEAFLAPPLAASGIVFDVVLSSETARVYKPEPAIFEQAAAALGLTASDMLYVGDSPRADIAGAVGAGWQMAWIAREAAELPDESPRPHLRLRTLDELLPALGLVPVPE